MKRRRVRISFDSFAGRWNLVDEASANRPDLVQQAPDVLLARSSDGAVVEMVVDMSDGAAPTPVALRAVEEAFGRAAAELLTTGSLIADGEVVVEAFTESLSSIERVPPLVGEIGIPVAQPDGAYLVPSRDSDLQLTLTSSSIVVTVRRSPGDGNSWVIVSDADTGVLLAIGHLVDSGDGAQSATITFGLAVAPEDLHVSVSDDPLEPVPRRAVRRSRWARDLLEEARRSSRFRPSRAAAAAAAAGRVGAAVGDQSIVAEADSLEKRARRRRLGGGFGVIALVFAAGGFSLARLVDDSPPSTPDQRGSVFYENCDAARAAGPTPLLRDQPGYRPGLDRDNDGKACE